MKINQFSLQPTSVAKMIDELMTAAILPSNYQTLSFKELLKQFLLWSFPETKPQDEILTSLLISKNESVAHFINGNEPFSTNNFYLLALQLLEFDYPTDFSLENPLKTYQDYHLAYYKFSSWGTYELIQAWYLLLCTHTKHGLSLIDSLSSKGVFKNLYDLPVPNKPIFFNGKSLPVYDETKLIREVVYVETSLDTDNDGRADLLRTEIMRPIDTSNGLKVPVIFTASPYNQGTNDTLGEHLTHHVNIPLQHKKGVSTSSNYQFNSNFSYQKINSIEKTTKSSFSHEKSYTLNDYFAVRGYAIIYAAGIGTKDSDGFQTCGSPEQTAATIAIIEWLTGKRKAFTNKTEGIEIKAWWCNQNVAMTGRSYLGTLATAAATSGIAGLKAIIPEAGITSWYDYYRENGLVMAPGGFQGEDADVLAAETFSKQQNLADYQKYAQPFKAYLKQMQHDMDRTTGDYNTFWDQRNYRHQFKNITADVLIVHGLNDWNVKPNQAKALYDALQELPVTTKLILHQGQHIYINAFRSIDYTDIISLWLANKLYNVANQADQILPNVIVQANNQSETWTPYSSWEEKQDHKTFYLKPSTLTESQNSTNQVATFNDHLSNQQFNLFCQQPAKWQRSLFMADNSHRLLFKTAEFTDEKLLRGTPQLTLSIASSTDHGMVSAQLVDFGRDKRLNQSPTLLEKNGIALGYHWRKDDLREFTMAQVFTDYKVISYGHINLQNRHGSDHIDHLEKNEFVDVTFDLQPIFHTFNEHHQLGLLIFSTDFAMSLRGNEDISYQINLEKCHLTLPTFQSINPGTNQN
ncbi:Xaa-Pro dipeptidyl-peptidase [Paucilactobacillus sp. N302-9]